jgi:hypothetical protein
VAYTRTSKRVIFDTDDLWNRTGLSELAAGRGCYVFAVKRGKAMLPFYVGLTETASFKREVFNPSNIQKYRRAVGTGKKYKAYLFLLVHPPTKKTGSPRHIGDLERFLITAAWARNPSVANSKGISKPKWIVPGVTSAVKGKATKSAQALRDAMGFKDQSHHLYSGRAKASGKRT